MQNKRQAGSDSASKAQRVSKQPTETFTSAIKMPSILPQVKRPKTPDSTEASEKSSVDLALEKMLQPTASQLLMGIARDVRNTTATLEEPNSSENMLGGLNLLATVSKYMNAESCDKPDEEDNVPKMNCKIEPAKDEQVQVQEDMNSESVSPPAVNDTFAAKENQNDTVTIIPDEIKISLKQGRIDTVVTEQNDSVSSAMSIEAKDVLAARPENKVDTLPGNLGNLKMTSLRGVRLLTLASHVSSTAPPISMSSGTNILHVVPSPIRHKPVMTATCIPHQNVHVTQPRYLTPNPPHVGLVKMRILQENALTSPVAISPSSAHTMNFALPSKMSTLLYRPQVSKSLPQVTTQSTATLTSSTGNMPTTSSKFVTTADGNTLKCFPGRIIADSTGHVATSLPSVVNSKNVQIISVSRPQSPGPMHLRSVSSTAGKTYIVLGSPRSISTPNTEESEPDAAVKDARILPFSDL